MTDVAGGLITREYVLTGLQYTDTKPARDADIDAYIQAATPVIEHLHGPVLQTTTTQRRRGGKTGVLLDGTITAAAVTAVRVDGAAWAGYDVDPAAGIVYAGSGRTFDGTTVEIDVTVGYATIPQNLQLATRELVRWWIQTGKQLPAAGVLGIAPGTDATVDDAYAIPRRVRQLCAPGAGSGFA